MPVKLQGWHIQFRLDTDGTKRNGEDADSFYKHAYAFKVPVGADGKLMGIYSERSLPQHDAPTSALSASQRKNLAKHQKKIEDTFYYMKDISVPGLSFELNLDEVSSHTTVVRRLVILPVMNREISTSKRLRPTWTHPAIRAIH